MMNGKNLILTILIVSLAFVASAQTYAEDAIRMGKNNISGTARFMGVGGAFASVGADFTNLSYNPAGIGMMRNSLISITPGYVHVKSLANFRGESGKRAAAAGVLANAGAVFSQSEFTRFNSATIRNLSFGLGINRIADYNGRQRVSAYNNEPFQSITHSWLNEIVEINGNINGEVSNNDFSFDAVNGYQTFLVNYIDSLSAYTSPINNGIQQTRYLTTSGGKTEMVLSGGGNLMDKLYFGATLAIPYINYESETRFMEEDEQNENGEFQDFELVKNYQTDGLGFNLKAGVIYKPVSFLRLGAAIHSPERMNMTERYSSSISSNFVSNSYFYESPEGTFDYVLRLPWRAQTGVSLFYKKNGFISFDYEVVDYSSTKYSFEAGFDDVADEINADLKANYAIAHNFAIGAEGVIKSFRVRAGYRFTDSPFKTNAFRGDYTGSEHQFSGGLGYVGNRFAMDFAGRYGLNKFSDQPYTLPNGSVREVFTEQNRYQFLFTLSYRLR